MRAPLPDTYGCVCGCCHGRIDIEAFVQDGGRYYHLECFDWEAQFPKPRHPVPDQLGLPLAPGEIFSVTGR